MQLALNNGFCEMTIAQVMNLDGGIVRTFDRYFIHFMGIGVACFVIALILMIVDGGELLVPIFIISITFVDLCFVVGMTVTFSAMAKPKKIKLKVNEDSDIVEALQQIAKKKWGRKQTIKEGNHIKFIFGNRYKDWLVTSIELIINNNDYTLYLPSSYLEDIRSVCEVEL